MDDEDIERVETAQLGIQSMQDNLQPPPPIPMIPDQQQPVYPVQQQPMHPGQPNAAMHGAVHPGAIVNQVVVNSGGLGNRKQTNHVLHLILTVFTFGLWSIVWLLVWAQNSSHNAKVGY